MAPGALDLSRCARPFQTSASTAISLFGRERLGCHFRWASLGALARLAPVLVVGGLLVPMAERTAELGVRQFAAF
jgi:hypothetical protein